VESFLPGDYFVDDCGVFVCAKLYWQQMKNYRRR
jgi:hypothetical protein